MCGEMEDEETREGETYARFVAHVHSLLASLNKGKSADPMHVHLDNMFRRLLLGAADHSKAPEEVDNYQRIAMEPLVFARLAGFIAAHLPLHEDPLRRVMEALMTGYAEGEILIPEHDHDHDHGHGHGHGHTH